MSDVTRILERIDDGDERASHELLPLVYDELRKLAEARMTAERPDHTLQPTALVHEAYMRLVDGNVSPQWDGRGHFFAAAAEAMRRILIESARRKKTAKRGGDRQHVEANEDLMAGFDGNLDQIIDFNDALEDLAKVDTEAAELVKLRLFAGLSVTEAGDNLHMSRTSAYECWQFARAWFASRMAVDE